MESSTNAGAVRVVPPQYYPQLLLPLGGGGGGCGTWGCGGWVVGFGTLLGPEESGPQIAPGGFLLGVGFVCSVPPSLPVGCVLVGGVGGWGV